MTNNYTSYGILCFDYDMTRIVVIERTMSYAFVRAMSLLLRYGNTECITVDLLDKMYASEKRLLFYGNFEHCIMHYNTISSARARRRNVNFDILGGVNGQHLATLLSHSKRTSRHIIEIPKGHRRPHETEYDAACREFTEETNIPLDAIKIIPRISIKYSFSDEGINYTYHLFPARLAKRTQFLPGHVDYSNRSQMQEVLSVQWLSLSELRSLGHMDISTTVPLDYTARNARCIAHMFSRVKQMTKLQQRKVLTTALRINVSDHNNDADESE